MQGGTLHTRQFIYKFTQDMQNPGNIAVMGLWLGLYENGVKSQKHKMWKSKTRVLLFYTIYFCAILL